MPRAIDVANYLLSLQDEDAGDTISNLKLQKLLYYAQGFHLAETDRPLFDERIEAWQHGPVVPAVYHEFKDRGVQALQASSNARGIYSSTAEFLNEVYRVYGQFSAWKLARMTHDEKPWKEAQSGGGVITHEALREYFSTRLS